MAPRTTTGCWTCRIRRKKCDDVQPLCGPCNFRQLTCHGYGPKPAWMDGAENQKAEVERIKQTMSQSFRSRRALRFSQKQGGQSRAGQAAQATSAGRPSLQEGDLTQTTANIHQLRIDESRGGAVSLPLVEPWPQLLPPDRAGVSQTALSSPGTLQDAPSKESIQPANTLSFHPNTPPADDEHDLGMIMNYLDKVFPLQFYFYQPSSSERGRGWLLGLLLRAKSSYFSALSLSCLQQMKCDYLGDRNMQQNLTIDLDTYHARALSELQAQLDYLPSVSGCEHLKTGVEILACMMQLLSIEVFREHRNYIGWKGDWEVHLHAAGDLLKVIGMDLHASTILPPSASGRDEDSLQRHSEAEPTLALLPLDEIAGLDFFMRVYIWADVFRCASIGGKLPDQESFPYLVYLKEDRIRLDHLMGCRNWAMLLIKEISSLEAWKQSMQKCRNLSIPILSRKAAGLEQRLAAGLKSLTRDPDAVNADQECDLVTQIYAQSAVTYLAIVVSGNSHILPEVRSSVVKSLHALKALPPHLLGRVSWAYCVAGCMADEVEKEEFRRLLFSADEAGHKLGTLWNALEIMEESWMLRENPTVMRTTDKCAWAVAMESLGSKILLV